MRLQQPKDGQSLPVPTLLPAWRWDDVSELPVSLIPVSKMEAEVCRQPRGGSQETAEMTDQHITATAGLSLEILSHTLLETENMGDTAPKEDTTEEELGGSTLRRYLG